MGGGRRAAHRAVELRLLGPLEAWRGGAELALGGPKPRALLAILALEVGRVVSVDRLVEDLWPGDPPESAPHAVQVYVSQLRKALGDAIAREGFGYRLGVEPEAVDTHRFAKLAADGHEELRGGNAAAATSTLREALALWRGPALADFAYEPFSQAEISRLEEVRFAALEDRIEADLALGRHSELVPEIEALVDAQPLRERPRALLMRALYLAGRQADALAAYRSARETLVEELGIEPGPELRELEAAILRQDESLVPSPQSASPAIRTRRLAAVLSVGLEADADDVEVEDDLLTGAASTVVSAVTRHGGVAERLADGSVLAVFGVPVAHEDDPVRAARAGVEARDVLAATETVAFRGAIEAGEVVAAGRTASGPPVRAAALLRQGAAAGELLVGKTAVRRLDRFAQFEGRGDDVALIELTEPTPSFARRPETELVGRKRELATLRKALKLARQRGTARTVLVVGPPGVGKSRLAAELTRRSRGVSALWGRCLSYGEGITYWPLREMLAQAGAGPEREAVLAALDADAPPPPAAEIALLFRRLCEASARRKPLVLVFDDLHWAERTFLELVEQVADKADGPLLAVCLAREELLEDAPGFLEGAENVERIELEGLSPDETETLLDRLDGTVLGADQRSRLADAAEGNPLFVEQLLALALEGGLTERALPETIQALLAARLDRLGPGERAVLERGAVVGKEFSRDDVAALLEPDAASTADAHLRTLADRRFLRGHDGAFAFRHVLVQEAVYRSAPKRLRAELHERFADRLDAAHPDVLDLDELAGYHLELAYRLRVDLGELDRRAEQLAHDAGRRLGAAGIRAWKRVDVPATTRLLGRATALLPAHEPIRLDHLCELGIATRTSGDPTRAAELLDGVIEESDAAGDRRTELRARIEREYVRLLQEPGTTAKALLDATQEGIAVFETVGDERALGRAWLLHGFVLGGHLGRHKEWEEAAERALQHYRNAGWPVSTCIGELAAALYYGPTPAPEGIARCEELLADGSLDRVGRAHVTAFLGGVVAQRGDFDAARAHVASARATYEELGQRTAAETYCGALLADVELLAGDAVAAEETLRPLCTEIERSQTYSNLASRASDLGEALYAQGDVDGAEQWTLIAEAHAAHDDLDAQMLWRSVRAKAHARRGALESAERLAWEAARLVGDSDGLNRRARVETDLGEVLRLAGKGGESSAALARALELYRRKGNVVGAAHTQALLDDVALP